MGAAARRTFAGCLLLVVVRSVQLGRWDGSAGTAASAPRDFPYDLCGEEHRQARAPQYCCPDVEDGEYGRLRWPRTGVNEWALVTCPFGANTSSGASHGLVSASRRCAFSSARGPVWRQSDFSKCKTEGATVQDAGDAVNSAVNMTSDPSKIDSAAFKAASELILGARQVAKTNRTVARTMLKALSNLVATPASVQADGDGDGSHRRALFMLLEDHGRGVRLHDDEYAYEHQLSNLHLAVYKVGLQTDGQPDLPAHLEFAAKYDGLQSDVSVHMTAEVVQQAMAAFNGTRAPEVRVRFMALRNAQLLVPPGALSASQQVVTAAVSQGPQADEQADEDLELDMPVAGLRQPVRIAMPLSTDSMGTTHVCAYYDETGGAWRTDGLTATLEGMTVVCESTHLTPFTLLLDPDPRGSLADMALPLTVLGSIGSVLSVLGLALTIVTYKFFSRIPADKMSIRRAAPLAAAPRASLSCGEKGFSQDRWGRVLVQLCLSLLLLHVAYLATNLKGLLAPPVCAAVAVVLHATLLASFCWMLVEGLLLYQILITVFRKADTNFILKRHVFAWGGPVALVALNAAVGPNYYLDTHPDYCVVSGANRLQHALSTLVPCCLVMVANFAIFVQVCVVLLRQRQTPGVRHDADDRPLVSWAQIRGVIGVAFLLGVTWPLSPLAANVSTLGVISSGLNAFQGVAIFVSRVLTHPEARRCWRQRFLARPAEFGSSATYSLSNRGSPWLCMRWSARKDNVATVPNDRQSIVKASKPWRPRDSSNNFSSSSGVVVSKTTSETDILY